MPGERKALPTLPFTPAAGPHTWSGTFGLDTLGIATAFKIFAITVEGNEKSSNAVTVTRPVE